MSKAAEQLSKSKSLLKGQNIFYAGVIWSVVALLFFLLYSVNAPGEESPWWYSIGTYILELGAFLSATLLCYRNWLSPQIASGRSVWLGIGLGMFCFLVGGLVFGVWELYFNLDPDVSPADLFYIAFYVFLGWGMILAVLPRRLHLELKQWGAILAIAVVAIALAFWVTFGASEVEEEEVVAPEPIEQIAPATDEAASESPEAAIAPEVAEEDGNPQNPRWVVATDEFLNQFSVPVNLFYVIADVGLLIIATALLLAFWGGRFSQSWRMIAAATFCLYIADMWSKYAYAFNPNYESGDLLEVFFVFSGILFGIGASLEYDVSTSRHARSRRRRSS
ncbi:hypothetical protein IQ249_03555 [Lusitaniella coriacea LEGE 07157]|uniref:Uncharacterized protein n=1 Tax=Lusitaniella coriacea LEGE 07157 TaxID=945747 RepID=A0A8J7DLF7_9CYAN|nr:hypothetical protein [Lusitaniella coriacea]MBE9114968.1 hypothetical protein [Lusitaniella coriacea LEGE 07157]